jgi:branched-chain amino acid transport system permease protein
VSTRAALGLACILAAAPAVLAGYQVTLLTEILILALFAMSLDLQVGYARMFSFGHAGPYGIGAYVTAFALAYGHWPLSLALLVGVGVTALLAVTVGWFCTRASGVAFAMLTFAFAQLAYAVAFKWNSVTGGSDGLPGLLRVPGPWGFHGLGSRDGYYWFTLSIVAVMLLVADGFVRSPMGAGIVAVRENAKRAEALGYNARALRLITFVVSNALAGVAGALHAGFLQYVSPELLYWTLSGQALVMVVLGGSGTLVGPMVGAAIVVLLGHELSATLENWPLVMGIIFITVVIAAPQGLWGVKSWLISRHASWRTKGRHVST